MSVQEFTYDPENWLISCMRSLGEYVKEAMPDEFYQVVNEFPGTETLNTLIPENKSVIHFEIDDIENTVLGFGNNYFRDNFDAGSGTAQPQEARQHIIDMDVGIWAWDKSGGTTSRMRAYQALTNLFHGSRAYWRTWNSSSDGDGGIEILSWNGGRFLTERLNDMPVYRTVDATLRVRLYSRTPMGAGEPVVLTWVQDPNLSIYVP